MITTHDNVATKEATVPTSILMAGAVGQALLFTVLSPALPSMATTLGAAAATVVPLVVALPSLGLIIAGFVAGPLIERFGPRRGLSLGLMGYVLFGILPAVTTQTDFLLASRLLLGLSCGIVSPSATVLLVACHDGEQRNRMLGYQTAIGSAIGLIALVAAGAVVAWLSWQFAFLLYGVCLVPMLLITIFLVPDLRPATEQAGSAFLPTLALLWPIYLVACLLFVVPVTCAGQLAFLLNASGTHDPILQSIIIAMMSVGSAISGAAFGKVFGIAGPRHTLALSLGVGGAGLMLIGSASAPMLVGLGMLLNGLAIGLYFSYFWLATTKLAPAEMRPHGIAMLSTAMFLGGFLYPVIFGLVSLPFGAVGGFVIMGGVMIIGAVATLVVPRGRLIL